MISGVLKVCQSVGSYGADLNYQSIECCWDREEAENG